MTSSPSTSCKAPATSMTIDPTGLITLCCNFNNGIRDQFDKTLPLSNIKDIDDLNEFFLKEYQAYNNVNRKLGWEALPECSECVLQKLKKVHTTKSWYDDRFPKSYDYYDSDLKLRMLEVTTSNICNQMCPMCGPRFSSKWVKNINKVWPDRELNPSAQSLNKYDVPILHLSKHDVEKIVKVIPQLDLLMLKGGEPFADQNNLKFLKAAALADQPMRIIIVSNMHEISDAFLDTIKHLRYNGHSVGISASIDATGDLYSWVRDGLWEKTRATCQKYYDVVGVGVNINSTVTCFTFPYLNDIYDELTQYDWSWTVKMDNIVRGPSYCSPSIFKQEFIDKVISNCIVPGWDDKYIKSFDNHEAEIKRTIAYINDFNNVRDKKLFDIKPDLEDYLA